MNLPLLWRLRSVPATKLVELAGRSGLRLDADAPAATAMVLGLASAAPVQLLAMMQAVGAGVDGRPAVATLPRIVERYRLLDEDGTISSETASGKNAVDLREYFKASGTAGFVQKALSAPLKPGGTLAALAAAGSDHERWHLAKTGTTTAGEGIRDKWVIGVHLTTTGLRGYALLVGSAYPMHPLGRRISGNQLTNIIRTLWQ